MNKSAEYANGQRKYAQDGNFLTHYFENGEVKARGMMINGLMEGKWIFNKKEGYLWQVGNFLKGERQGNWTRYKADGSVADKKEFKDDKQVK